LKGGRFLSKTVTELVTEFAKPIVEELGLELVDVEYVKEGKDWFLRVFIDSETGIDLEQCGAVSEKLSEVLDEKDPIENLYFLDVSSPGAERPLKKEEDFIKAIGKYVALKTYEPIQDEKNFEGKLLSYSSEEVVLELTIKTRKKQITIPTQKIASARLAVTFF
jgi:ribosome maturation factor RimP